MPRRAHAARIETRSARLKLKIADKPYDFVPIAPGGVGLGYRRNKQAGAWVLRIANGKGGYRTTNIGLADDLQDADGDQVLSFFQAVERGRKLAKGDTAEGGSLLTFGVAINEYGNDLVARGALVANAARIRAHLPPALAGKPVSLLTARELSAWRDGLLRDGMKPATVVRLGRAVKAALNLAAKRDHAIANRAAWADGLSGVSENFASRNIERLDDDQVRAMIAASYALDHNFGLYVEVAAETGARPSQISRLVVSDLQTGDAPRLMMPSSHKGRGRKPGKYPVPVTRQLAMKLASDREPNGPLLLRSDGRRWQESDPGDHLRLFKKAAASLGLNATLYVLRHSAIVRSLLAGVPLRIVAVSADTSVPMIEKTYSSYLGHFADEVARRGLLTPASTPADVVALKPRRK